MKKILALLLLMFFSLQVFPVLEMGKVLSKQQLAEETGELDTTSDDYELKLKKDDPFQSSYFSKELKIERYYSNVVTIALQSTDIIPQFFIPDILTPPPNHTT